MSDEREYLQFLHAYYADSVKNADQKALIVLTIAIGVFLFLGAHSAAVSPVIRAVTATASPNELAATFTSLAPFSLIRALLWLSAMMSSLAVQISGFMTLQPRTKTSWDDTVYWANIARLDRSEFVENIHGAIAAEDNAGLYANIYNLSHILQAKFRNAANATAWTLFMICSAALFMILSNSIT